MLNVFFILALFNVFASEPCPPESTPIEYRSMTSNYKKVTCGYLQNGTLIKHGDEISYDKPGIPLSRETFFHGVKTNQTITSIKLDIELSFEIVEQLLKIFSFGKENTHTGIFNFYGCNSRRRSWAKEALIKESFSDTYEFGINCDLAGSFKATFLEIFPVVFDVRNLNDFKRTKMMVKMKITQSAVGVRYGFEVSEGMITNGARSIVFEALHEVDIDPLTGGSKMNTQVGKITLKRIDNRPVSIIRPLIFHP